MLRLHVICVSIGMIAFESKITMSSKYRECIIKICMIIILLVGLPTEPTLDVGCESNADCPDYTACENRQCINPCAIRDPCAPSAICKVVRHEPVCTCPDGYIGNPQTSCELRKY